MDVFEKLDFRKMFNVLVSLLEEQERAKITYTLEYEEDKTA